MQSHPISSNRLTISYRDGRGRRGRARKVICTITAPQKLLAVEVDLADALINVLERRTVDPVVEA